MRDDKGRFVKGEHYNTSTEFKKGQHWRPRKPYWDRDWLYVEYVKKGRPANEIAQDFAVTEEAIRFWLKKLGIERRDMSTIRKMHKWGLSGEKNGMYGVHGEKHPNWKGGVTPERQQFYQSEDWSIAARAVWRRDQYRCQRCGIRKSRSSQRFHIHHRVSFAIPDFRAAIDYMALLCDKCHYWVHSKANVNGEWIDDVPTPVKGGDDKDGSVVPRGE